MTATRSMLLATIALAWSGLAAAASLDVTVLHLRPSGRLCICLYRDARSWIEGTTPAVTRWVDVRSGSSHVRFDDLPPGRYAVRAVQNRGGNGWIDAMPTFASQRVANSGTLARHGKPRFERAAVDVGPGENSLRLYAMVRDSVKIER